MVAPVGTRRSIGSGKAHVLVVSYIMVFIKLTFIKLIIFDGCRSATSRVICELNAGRNFGAISG